MTEELYRTLVRSFYPKIFNIAHEWKNYNILLYIQQFPHFIQNLKSEMWFIIYNIEIFGHRMIIIATQS